MAASDRGGRRRPGVWASAFAALLVASLLPVQPAWSAAAETAGPAAGSAVPVTTRPAGRAIPADWVPPPGAVASLRLALREPVQPAEAPLPLHATHPDHRPAIALVLDLLAGSRLAAGPAAPSPKGPVLQIALRRGEPIAVLPAGDCPDFSRESGHGFTCPPAEDEVVLQLGAGQGVRLFNPRMAAWLREGWRAHVPIGEPVPLDREAATALAREQSRLPKWQASFVDAYPVERPGGTEVRPAWVMEAELPAGQRIRLVLDAHTGAVLRLVQLEALE